jgi:hypothetical protein
MSENGIGIRSDHYVRTWGLGFGFGGKTVRLTNEQFWFAMLDGRIRYSLGEIARRTVWNMTVEQYESQRHPGADAACISFDDA